MLFLNHLYLNSLLTLVCNWSFWNKESRGRDRWPNYKRKAREWHNRLWLSFRANWGRGYSLEES